MKEEQINEVMRLSDEVSGAVGELACSTNESETYESIDAARAALKAYLSTIGEPESVNAELLEALRTFESSPKPGAFRLGDLVKKVSGSAWEGRIVGTYSTALTPEGYAVESASHPGSVQIYPAKALTLVIQEAGIQPTEGQHAQHVDVSGENVNATFRISKQTGADALVGLRGCNRRHGGMRAVEPCTYRMRTTDPGCTGCVERDALAAELKEVREQEPVGVVDESDDGLFADLETPDGVVVKQGDKLYAHPVPARKVTDAIQAIGRRSTPMRADEGRSPLEFDNGWNQCLDAIERHLKGEGE